VNPIEAEFLADICAHPDDDAPRLIYADWLTDEGREARAEFIRVQVRAAAVERTLATPYEWQDQCGGVSDFWCPTCGDCCCRHPEDGLDDPGCPLHAPTSRHAGDDSLRSVLEGLKRQAVSLQNRQPAWWSGYPISFTVGAWRRGFIDEAHCALAVWMSHGKELLRGHPARRVTLTDARPVRDVMGLWPDAANPGTTGRWGWCRAGFMGGIEYSIPDDIFARLGPSPLPCCRDWWACGSEKDATGALSDACIRWAKGRS
jgi:uncharacterized protein (TIGR02996 family)